MFSIRELNEYYCCHTIYEKEISMSLLDESFMCEHCDRMVTPNTICGYLGCDRYSPRYEEGNDEEYIEDEQMHSESLMS